MTAPALLSVQYIDSSPSNSLAYVIFDRAVSGTASLGWTVILNGSPVIPAATSIQDNAVLLELATAVAVSSLTVAYNSATGDLVEAVAPNDPVASFSAQTAIAYPTLGQAVRAQAGVGANDVLVIYFGEPVAAVGGDLLAGLTIEVDDQALDLSSAVASLNAGQTELSIDTGTNFSYADVVDVVYDAGTGTLRTWPTGAISDFTFNAVDNLSTDGLPNSSYPLSSVIAGPVTVCQQVAVGTVQVSLNPIDIELVERYGPVTVVTGGTFGVTVGNPTGVTVLGAEVSLVDGLIITQNFTSTTMSWATDAALDWQTQIKDRVGIALGQIRATDQSVTLGDRTVSQV